MLPAGPFADEGVVDLDFKTSVGESGLLEDGVEVDAGIASSECFYVGLQLEVFEVGVMDVAGIEKVRTRTVRGKEAIDNFPGIAVLVRFPSGERMAVEEWNPFALRRGRQR